MLPAILSLAVMLTGWPALPARAPAPASGDGPPVQSESPHAEQIARARALVEQGHGEQAVELLQPLLADGQDDRRSVRLALAGIWLARGRPESGLQVLDPVADPDDHDVTLAMGTAFRAWADAMAAEGRRAEDTWFAYDEARAKLTRAAELAPEDDPRAQIALIDLLLYVYGEHDDATRRAEALGKAHTDNGEVLLLRGCVLVNGYWRAREAGDDKLAAATLDRAVADLLAADEHLGDERTEPWAQLAWLYEQEGQAQRAVEAATEVVQRSTEPDLGTLYALARRYASENELRAAGRALVSMAESRPAQLGEWVAAEADRTTAATNLAWVAVNLGSRVQSLLVLDAVMQADPEDAATWNNYGYALREARRYEDAYRAYERSVALDDSDPRVLNDTAVVLHYYLRRDTERATALYEQAVEIADRELRRPKLSTDRKRYLREARLDARNNLSRLERGVRTERG